MLKIAWDPKYVLPLPSNHRFPMSKYELLPAQLLHEGTIQPSNLFSPHPGTSDVNILSVHNADYWEKLKCQTLSFQEERRTGFPLSAGLIEREVMIASGTIECTRYALQYGIAMNIAGGTHHAFTDHGEGFCLLNDQAMAASYLLRHQLARKILIIDLDVHQGNGTAEIFRAEESVFTFSMHGANNYPLIKETSDLDIGLPDFTNDAFYLSTLDKNVNNVLDHFAPDFIFYQAGVDILETDKLGRLSISREGSKARDRFVLELAHRHRIPAVVSMGGGYSPNFNDIIEAHANTYRLAQYIFF